MAKETNRSFDWYEALIETYQSISQRVVDFAPQLIGAVLLLLVGWVLACILRLVARRLVQSLDVLFKTVSKHDGARRERLKQSYTLIIGQIVFWVVILFFLAASANLLGWNMFSGWMDSIVGFLPNLITGLLIILAGYLISAAVRSAVLSTGLPASGPLSNRSARAAQIAIIFCSVIIGVEQIGLNMSFLTSIVVVVTGILLAGGCLAFSLGATTLAANAIGAQYTRKNCKVGEHLKIGDAEGEILEIRQTCIILETKTGRIIVPAKLFQERISSLDTAEVEPSAPNEKTPNQEGESSE